MVIEIKSDLNNDENNIAINEYTINSKNILSMNIIIIPNGWAVKATFPLNIAKIGFEENP